MLADQEGLLGGRPTRKRGPDMPVDPDRSGGLKPPTAMPGCHTMKQSPHPAGPTMRRLGPIRELADLQSRIEDVLVQNCPQDSASSQRT
jgi:hypothetical protein